jgi:hypothetical protein
MTGRYHLTGMFGTEKCSRKQEQAGAGCEAGFIPIKKRAAAEISAAARFFQILFYIPALLNMLNKLESAAVSSG